MGGRIEDVEPSGHRGMDFRFSIHTVSRPEGRNQGQGEPSMVEPSMVEPPMGDRPLELPTRKKIVDTVE